MEFTETSLAKVGVKITDEERIWLQCRTCKVRWPLNISSNGKLPRHYWQCPNGCNAWLKDD